SLPSARTPRVAGASLAGGSSTAAARGKEPPTQLLAVRSACHHSVPPLPPHLHATHAQRALRLESGKPWLRGTTRVLVRVLLEILDSRIHKAPPTTGCIRPLRITGIRANVPDRHTFPNQSIPCIPSTYDGVSQ